MNIAFCSSEVFPFAKTGGLGDVCGSLPLALARQGINISIFLPGYRSVKKSDYKITPINEYLSKARLAKRITVYFINHKVFFDREGLYGDEKGDYSDNLTRFQFYCLEVLKAFKDLNLKIDIVHCHDWQTALIPVYLKERYGNDKVYSKIKTVLTIHNLAFQGLFPKSKFSKLGIDQHLFSLEKFEFYGKVNLLKAGIIYSDIVTTVSPQYAKEIQTHKFGCGLEGVLRHFKGKVWGVLNGLDYNVWNSKTDPFLVKKYSARNVFRAKEENKIALQEKFGLKVDKSVPLFGFVGRLSHQKGIDFILDAATDFLKENVQIVILGVGQKEYEKALKKISLKYPQQFALALTFDEELAHQVYAGSDFFLMPSQFEPCGLSQMISLCYGTIPVVCQTGGLVDTIKPFRDLRGDDGNGFVFQKNTKQAFMRAVIKALKTYQDRESFKQLINRAVHSRFSWDDSAKKYQEIYRCLLLV